MSTVLIVILLLIVVFAAASLVLSRTTHEVGSARDTEYLELEGDWIRYSVTGGGPPVVLVHGWLSSSRIWEQLVDELARRFTVYTLDLSGFGDSDKPISGYGIRYGSRLLYAFCAHFGLTQVAVVGHNFGGAMAVKLTADHADIVERIVLVATPADEDQIDLPTFLWLATLPVIGPVYYMIGRFLSPLRKIWMRPFVLDPENLTEEVVDDAGKSTPAALAKTLAMVRREIARGRLVRQARIIKVPVLTVAGEEDQIVDPQAANAWGRALPAEVVLLTECGHLPMLERTAEFNAQVLTFLTGDSNYLDAGAEPPREMTDKDVAEMPEEPPPLAYTDPDNFKPAVADPDSSPSVVRKQEGRYPPRNHESSASEDHQDASSPPVDRGSDPSTTEPNEGDKIERRHRNDTRNEGNPPEVPEGLFEWPGSLKKPKPWDRSSETEWQEGKHDEDADPGEPEDEPRSPN